MLTSDKDKVRRARFGYTIAKKNLRGEKKEKKIKNENTKEKKGKGKRRVLYFSVSTTSKDVYSPIGFWPSVRFVHKQLRLAFDDSFF
jgi:hypothetical protein